MFRQGSTSQRVYTPQAVWVIYKNGVPINSCANKQAAILISQLDGARFKLVPFTRNDTVEEWVAPEKIANTDSVMKAPYQFDKGTHKWYRG